MSSALAKRIKRRRYVDDSEDGSADEILAIGYSCNLFRDDEKAEFINEERHLIVHSMDDSVTTDRFDVRLCLNDLHLYDSSNVGGSEDADYKEEDVDHTELELERYRDLIAAEDDGNYEEGSNQAVESPADGQAATSNENSRSSPFPEGKKSRKEHRFTPSEELELPEGMQIPDTTQLHAIIAKTATFIAAKGPQMEIVIKAKQRSNDHHFGFLEFDHVLRPYYDHLLSMIKKGRYKYVEELEESDEDSEDGDYLHPSLMISAMKAKEKQPEIEPKLEKKQAPAVLPTAEMLPIIDRLAEYVARNGDHIESVVRSRGEGLYGFVEPDHGYNAYYRQRVDYYLDLYQQQVESSEPKVQRIASGSPTVASSSSYDQSETKRGSYPQGREDRITERKHRPRRSSDDEDRYGTRYEMRRKNRKRYSSRSSGDASSSENRRQRRRSLSLPKEKKYENGNERKAGKDPLPTVSDKAVDESIDTMKEKEEATRKLQEERRAKAKKFLQLIREREQGKVVDTNEETEGND